jgi:hypothetical protein
MEDAEIQRLREELLRKEERRQAVSAALLEPAGNAEQTKALLDEGAELDEQIAQLAERIRALEYPGRRPGEPLNPWDSD